MNRKNFTDFEKEKFLLSVVGNYVIPTLTPFVRRTKKGGWEYGWSDNDSVETQHISDSLLTAFMITKLK